MSTATQPEYHPDTDRLNAFAEQALSERERGQVLTHLAVCGRCRQVVTLAREAAQEAIFDAESAASAAAPAARRAHGADFRFVNLRFALRFAWIPAAALAATAALTVYVHVRRMEQSAELAKNQRENMAQTVLATASAPQEEPAEAAPPAAHAHQKYAARATRTTPRPGTESERPGVPEGEPREEASASAPTASQAVTMDASSYGTEEAAPAAGAMMRQPTIEAPAGGGSTAAYQAMPPAAWVEQQKPAERQRRAEQQKADVDAMYRHAFAAKATAPASVHGTQGGAGDNRTAPAVDSSQPPDRSAAAPRPQAQAPSGTLMNADGAVKKLHLPSGLRVASIAAAGPRMLAIDADGAVFLSEDSGDTWEHVNPQWTGRAVEVRRQAEIGAVEAAPAAASANAGSGSGSSDDVGAAPTPAIFFEILNDHNQVWLSTDGRTWVAK